MGLRKFSLLAGVWFALLVGSNAQEQYSEQERRPIKTFKTIYGEIIDCINIFKQPAFDHPLLKDHKLQKKPSLSLIATKHRQREQVNQLERSHVLDGCPDGTIPILRTTKEDRMRANFFEQTRPQIYHPLSAKSPGFHFAYVELHNYPNTLYTGAKAFINNYIPKCGKGQFSAAQIWIISDINNPTNMIEAGWTVDPDLYNDDRSHLFISWKADGAGCYDLRCPGFVQVDNSITLGQILPNTSVYDGLQFEIYVAIHQEANTKDWWLTVKKDNVDVNVGYWPAKLFPQLASGAKILQFGGATHTSNGMPFPPMGSGYFPDNSYKHACVFRQIQYLNSSQSWKAPESWRGSAETSSQECYRATTNNEDQFMGYTLLFGGPGGDGCGA
ncbi:hypothetical protein BT93_I1621 [Corymbia citriodora subsp. variegata]|nr:hypothetical protein BT93_I1621 [Corymbia citriodora subsp. variegata]